MTEFRMALISADDDAGDGDDDDVGDRLLAGAANRTIAHTYTRSLARRPSDVSVCARVFCTRAECARARNRINWLDNELMNELRDEWQSRQRLWPPCVCEVVLM